MANLFKSLMSRDDDEELDLEFDIADPERTPVPTDCFEFPPDKRDNQVLAVWGSPSSGKTIISVKLARYIASQKKNVILVLADMSACKQVCSRTGSCRRCPTSAQPPILKPKIRLGTFSVRRTLTEILSSKTPFR